MVTMAARGHSSGAAARFLLARQRGRGLASASTASIKPMPPLKRQQQQQRVRTVLGTMSIPQQLDLEDTVRALEVFREAGHIEVDTAIMYEGGQTEKTLGEAGLCSGNRFKVAAKANPWFKDGRTHGNEPVGGLRADRVKEQLRVSLASLRTDSVDLFYLHAPDYDTPLEETLLAVYHLSQEGLFKEWGLSNYAAWEIAHAWNMCRQNGWPTPSVYQGMYNPLTRAVEPELLPCLRRLGLRFYAFNPLAGGILSGKYKFDKAATTGRYAEGTVMGDRYRERFWHKEIFDALDVLKEICAAHSTTLPKASLGWMYHHSGLSGEHGDAVIVGGSSVEQIKSNMEVSVDTEPLPQEVANGFEAAWRSCRGRCPPYFR